MRILISLFNDYLVSAYDESSGAWRTTGNEKQMRKARAGLGSGISENTRAWGPGKIGI